METINTITGHRSIRLFQEREVDEATTARLVACALRAPTAALGHFYSVILVREPELRAGLRRLCGGQKALENSAWFLFCVDLRRTDAMAQHVGTERRIRGYTALMWGAVDATLAAQNLSLAAESLGLGTCYVGSPLHRASDVCDLLGLPSKVLPLFLLAVGHPAEDPQPRPRLAPDLVVHRDRYRDPEPEEIAEAVSTLGRFSAGSRSVDRRTAQRVAFVRSIIEGEWWDYGERQLASALRRQGLEPTSRPDPVPTS